MEIIDGLKDAEYHARPELGSTSVKTLAKYPPAVYRWQADNPQPASPAMNLGTAAHELILEDSDGGLYIVDHDSYRTKAAQVARAEAYGAGLTPILKGEYDKIWNMRAAVQSHPAANELLTGHIPERSYFTELHGVPVKARPDAINGRTVVDLKTTGADLSDVARSVNNFGYYIQQAHYTDVMEACGETVDDFVFIFVSTQAPHMVRVIRLEESAVDLGREHARHGLEVYKACTEAGYWPGYEGIDTVDLPAWVYAMEDEEEVELKL